MEDESQVHLMAVSVIEIRHPDLNVRKQNFVFSSPECCSLFVIILVINLACTSCTTRFLVNGNCRSKLLAYFDELMQTGLIQQVCRKSHLHAIFLQFKQLSFYLNSTVGLMFSLYGHMKEFQEKLGMYI